MYASRAFPLSLLSSSQTAILARLANLGYSDTSGNMGKLIEAVSGKVTFTGTINATSGNIAYTSPALIKTPALTGDPTKNSASFMATAVLVSCTCGILPLLMF